MDKKVLRKKYLKIRRNINKYNKEKYDIQIFRKIIQLEEYKKSKMVLIYASLKDEVDTIELIKYSLNSGKVVAVPKCKGRRILFYRINSLEELEEGTFGVLEPNNKDLIKKFENSICIVPGVAFDKENNRIGYGKGFYDRFLKSYNGVKIGLAYRECICDKIDSEINDIKMDKIITN